MRKLRNLLYILLFSVVCSARASDTTFPGVGHVYHANFGSDTPFGRFAADIKFESPTVLSFVVTNGAQKGGTDRMDYTSNMIRPGLYLVRWHEPKSGAYVTHVEDFENHTVSSSIVNGTQFLLINGTFTLKQ